MKMTRGEAQRLLSVSRRVRWSYPTSQGRPVKWEGAERMEKMADERGSFTKAVTFLLRNGQEELATEMAAKLWRLWALARDYGGGKKFLAPVVENRASKATRARALVLYGDSLFAFRLGNFPESKKASEAALRVAKSVGDREALALANIAVGRIFFEAGDYRGSLGRSRDARRLARGLGPEYQQAPLFLEASSRRMLGDYEEAASLFRQSVELNRRLEDRRMVMAELNNLSFVEIHNDRADAAERAFDESERMAPTPSDDFYGQGMILLFRGMVAYRRSDIQGARSLLSRSSANFKRSGVQPGNDDKSEIDWLARSLKGAGR